MAARRGVIMDPLLFQQLQVLLLSLRSSSSVSFLSPGQIQEVPLSQKEPSPQVEVTPELDLEVVPESSTDWHVFH